MREREQTGDRKGIRETDSDHSASGGRLTDFPRPAEPAARCSRQENLSLRKSF